MPDALVRPEFRPTLPEIAQQRLRIPPRLTVAAVVAVVVLAGLLALAINYGKTDPRRQLIHHGAPVYNLLYPASRVHVAAPDAGELTRLAARKHDTTFTVSVRRLELPPFTGNVAGVFGIVGAQKIAELRRSTPGFTLLVEGKARLNDAPGYQVGFRAGPPSHRVVGLDVLTVPEDSGKREGVVVSFRQIGPVPLDAQEAALRTTVKKVFRSFRFGTQRKY